MTKDTQIKTVPERVFDFLKSEAPAQICDDCIAGVLHITPRNQINPIASAFGLTREFRREKSTCGICDSKKLVTNYVR